jgi:CBS domain-containing protein
MSTRVLTCSPDDSLERAAQLLWEGDCGALPVVDTAGRLVAMITDRDVCMAVYFRGCAPCHSCVRDAMSKTVFVCSPDDTVERVCGIISEHQVRRVPVIDAEGRLIGVVSLADVAHYLNELPAAHPNRQLLVTTMASVCDRQPSRALISAGPLSSAAA